MKDARETLQSASNAGSTDHGHPAHAANRVVEASPLDRPWLLAVGLAASFLGGLGCLLLLLLQWQTDLSTSDVAPTSPTQHHTTNAALIVATVLPGLLLLGGTCLPWRNNLGLGLPAHRPIGAAVEATTATLWVATFVSLAASWAVVTLFPQTLDTSTSTAHRALTTGQRALVSLHAGVQEETLDVVLPVMTAPAVIVVIRMLRRKPVRPAVLAGESWVWRTCVVVAAAGLLTRVLDHLYQGPVHAVAAAVWGTGFLIVFALHRSVWPLITGHFLYDFVVVALLPGRSLLRAAVVLIVGVAVIVLVRALNRRHREQAQPARS